MKLRSDKYTSGEKALTQNEFDKLMSVVDNFQDETLFKVAVSTGIRRADLTNIKIADIKDNQISFYEAKKRRIWTVPISKDLNLLIAKLINSRGKQQSEFLFTFSDRTAYRKLQEYCEKAGIPGRPFHALRATCVKFCQAAGWTLEQVSKLTGDTIAVIQVHYSTPSVTEMLEVVDAKEII